MGNASHVNVSLLSKWDRNARDKPDTVVTSTNFECCRKIPGKHFS